MTDRAFLTHQRRLGPGAVLRTGSVAPYRAVAALDGEPHIVRNELVGPHAEIRARGGALLSLAHVTDVHVTDVESPVRFEFVNRQAGDSRFRELLPMHRPQEALNVHAIEAMVRALNSIESGPLTDSPPELVIMSGDAIDNTQANELAIFMSLFDGGLVSPGSGGPKFESVQAPDWPDDIFWKPDGGAFGRDQFRVAYGFPHLPGLLDRGRRPFDANGFRLPWLGCHGNHEDLCQGVGVMNAELAAAMIAGRKPIALPDGLEAASAVDTFVARPQAFMAGASVGVTPDPARRPAGLRAFVDAHFRSGAQPDGHGFTAINRRDGTAHYTFDTPVARIITLDTACPAGGADGRLDRPQLAWLEDRLAEVHSSYANRSGETVRTNNDDKLVVIVSHHPIFMLRNSRAADGVDGDELVGVLHRFANVVLVLNGHLHLSVVQPHAKRDGVGVGFWEVTTCSLVDWPCQARLVEFFDAGAGLLAIGCTMVDHDGEPDPAGTTTPAELAGLHRQLAGNDPLAGFDSGRAGTPADRNVILPLQAPFDLNRLHRHR